MGITGKKKRAGARFFAWMACYSKFIPKVAP